MDDRWHDELAAPKRYRLPARQAAFEAAFRFDPEFCLLGGGALQLAFKAGYTGAPIGRHAGAGAGSLSSIAFRAGQARAKHDRSRT